MPQAYAHATEKFGSSGGMLDVLTATRFESRSGLRPTILTRVS